MKKGTHTLPPTTKDRNEKQNKQKTNKTKKTKTKKMKTKSLQKISLCLFCVGPLLLNIGPALKYD